MRSLIRNSDPNLKSTSMKADCWSDTRKMEGLRYRAREACKAAMGESEKLGNTEKVWLAQFSEGGRLPGALSCFGETVKLTGQACPVQQSWAPGSHDHEVWPAGGRVLMGQGELHPTACEAFANLAAKSGVRARTIPNPRALSVVRRAA